MVAALPAALAVPSFAASPGSVHVFKNPDCGCCSEWVKHLEAARFAVKVTPVSDTGAMRKRLHMPDQFGSCHTATVDDYVLEGHVPAAEVRRLLSERPVAVGLAVPGMPVGSPGMEVPGAPAQPFDVLLVSRSGSASVYARYPKR
jgi:hypothetical protein